MFRSLRMARTFRLAWERQFLGAYAGGSLYIQVTALIESAFKL